MMSISEIGIVYSSKASLPILKLLMGRGPMRFSDIIASMHARDIASRKTVADSLKSLLSAGLVKKEKIENRKTVIYALTDSGQRLLPQLVMKEGISLMLDELMEAANPDPKETLKALFSLVVARELNVPRKIAREVIEKHFKKILEEIRQDAIAKNSVEK